MPASSHARELFLEYAAQIGIDLSAENFADYAPPRGCLHVHYEGEHPAACAAIRPFSDSACELKRLFVRPAFRGKRLGRHLVEEMIGRASEIGYRSMLLDTMPSMREAIALYRELGFEEVPPYRESKMANLLYFELKISRTCSTNCRDV